MARAKIQLGEQTKKPFLAAGRIVRELAGLTPKGREIAMAMVTEHKFEAAVPADTRAAELQFDPPDGVI